MVTSTRYNTNPCIYVHRQANIRTQCVYLMGGMNTNRWNFFYAYTYSNKYSPAKSIQRKQQTIWICLFIRVCVSRGFNFHFTSLNDVRERKTPHRCREIRCGWSKIKHTCSFFCGIYVCYRWVLHALHNSISKCTLFSTAFFSLESNKWRVEKDISVWISLDQTCKNEPWPEY